MTKLDGTSLDIKQNQIKQLKQIFPEVVTEGKIDREKLLLTLGDDAVISGERYVLNWAGKTDAYRAVQTQTTATLKPQRDQSVDFDTTQNIFIEGENLEVLKVLQRAYYGKVKMITIDPPYNTGNDSFIYPDKFSETKEQYLKRIGDKDEAGYLTKEGLFRKNSRESGQFHSNWLSMMYPRLFLARNLLREDGVIFVSIDDNEVHNLRLMMNEIFGEENFIADIIWEKRYGRSNDARLMASVVDHILLYRKSELTQNLREPRTESSNSIYSNPDDDPRGPWASVSFVSQRTKGERPNLSYKIKNPFTNEIIEHPSNAWKYSKEKYENLLNESRFYWGKDGTQKYPRIKRFLSELPSGIVPINLWKYKDVGTGDEGTKEVENLIGKDIFDHPKPTGLLKRIINLGLSNTDDETPIILDFFAGSGSTAHAVYELNNEDDLDRKFILVQIPETCEEDTPAFLQGYKNIAEVCKSRIKKASEKIKIKNNNNPELFKNTDKDIGFKSFTLEPSNFKIWRTDTIVNEEDLKRQMEAFVDPVRPDAEVENMAWEILLKSGYELSTPLERTEIAGIPVYIIAHNEQILLLESLSQEAIDEIISRKPGRVVCLDRLFNGNDQLKTNTALQMKDAGVEFRTV